MKKTISLAEAVTCNVRELKEHYPDRYEREYQSWREGREHYPPPWEDETWESAKAVAESLGFDWHKDFKDYYTFDVANAVRNDMETYAGKKFPDRKDKPRRIARNLAFLENNLYGPKRIPWKHGKLKDYMKYNTSYPKGHRSFYCGSMVVPCPFTGYCGDDDLMDAVKKAVLEGETIPEAVDSMLNRARELVESDREYDLSEENFLDLCEEAFTVSSEELWSRETEEK